ncbi:ABC transporter ATP-binding protein [Clostridioides sp. ES-S-0005-03]|uniref:ABC transporter ATP-binding protein n=1 Tax=unclassified Clostridioides TaxID=2635829 RepID=UPI001D0CAC35|nr:ABC transporter ATP-binding protein [Clostridioides sp. ES-S-0005-03]MCC0694709.1 ABC transporter ATP-binding protein [Clostridioides sp. ES-S-0048-02]MCC0762877.1 ABC transporter ATP-binding protein [Clostridioides sp. ES-S-0006-03]UDN46899.1 ABC transporter ATP-binding protein [Clostridioides sp. ES-S-0173-01]
MSNTVCNSGYIIRNLSKSYKVDNEEHVVLSDISLDIDRSHITVILGESGCGKTTLLRAIASLEDINSGDIRFVKDNKEYKPNVGFVFQESRLMPWLNVSENIAFHNQQKSNLLNKIFNKLNPSKSTINKDRRDNNIYLNEKNKVSESNKQDSIDIEKYLKMMNLQKFKNSYPNELSGGMAQRVSIARALSFNPDMLFMDEPFSALDYFTRIDMQNEVVRIHKSTNKGVIFVTHDIDEALKIGKKIVVFTNERKIEEFNIEDDYNRDLTSNYYIKLKKDILMTMKSNKGI